MNTKIYLRNSLIGVHPLGTCEQSILSFDKSEIEDYILFIIKCENRFALSIGFPKESTWQSRQLERVFSKFKKDFRNSNNTIAMFGFSYFFILYSERNNRARCQKFETF